MTNTKTIRSYKYDSELWFMAENIASKITVRIGGGTSKDITRKPNAKEYALIRDIAHGALLGLNYGEATRTVGSQGAQAIIDAAEYTLDVMFEQRIKLREAKLDESARVNGYMTIYCPLQKALQEWGTEA